MHHQSAVFGSHETLLMGSSTTQEQKLEFPSFNPEEFAIRDQFPSATALDFHVQRKVRFDPTVMEPKPDHLPPLMHGSNYQHCFDPSAFSHPSVLEMQTSGNFYYLPDGFSSDVPANSGSVASTILNEPSMRDLIYSLPHEYGEFLPDSREYVGLDEGYEGHHGGQHLGNRRNRGVREGKETGTFKSEKQRRERFSMKYLELKSLIPNQTKPDRATIIADTIDYINELLRTAKELKMLVEKKRQRRDRSKKLIMMDEVDGDTESTSMKHFTNDQDCDLKVSLRSSWLQRKSKDTVVDVRIVEDEAYIKLTRRKTLNCLLLVSKALDELQLRLLHLSGGNIGDCHIFMLSAKIHEGSSVYASAIAKKLIEALDVEHQRLACN